MVSALKLGREVKSSIDEASIPSAVFVAPDVSTIEFGEQALQKGLRGKEAHLFDQSPKLWMTVGDIADLDKEIQLGTGVTRKHLLAGLLGQAFHAARRAGAIRGEVEFRVGHPVWDPARAMRLREVLRWLKVAAERLAGVTTNGPVARAALLAALEKLKAPREKDEIDVVEPVAAALELFRHRTNAREMCAVIDVGAGTTDMAVFLSVTSDEAAVGYPRRFWLAAPPRSIPRAGDFIDEQLLKLILSRTTQVDQAVKGDLQRRRRQIKETLFWRGEVFEANVLVKLSELEGQPGILEMQKMVAREFGAMISASANFMQTYVEAKDHRVDELNVIFAGGGSDVKFLRQAIGKRVRIGDRDLPVVIRQAQSVRGLPASVERLAVALGGTTPKKDWPVTEQEPGEWQRRRGTRQ